jgi:hypothetical protein
VYDINTSSKEPNLTAPILCCFAFSFGFIFIQMDYIASNVLTAPILTPKGPRVFRCKTIQNYPLLKKNL